MLTTVQLVCYNTELTLSSNNNVILCWWQYS